MSDDFNSDIEETLARWEDLDESNNNEASNSKEKWTENLIKLMLEIRLGMEDRFQKGEKSRTTLWGIAFRKMKEKVSLNLTVKDIQKKFRNMVVTYNRIKARNKLTGRNAVAWKYFDIFNNAYGSKHNIDPPPEILFDSLRDSREHSMSPNTGSASRSCTNQSTESTATATACTAMSTNATASTATAATSLTPKRKRTTLDLGVDLLEYLKESDEEEKKRHQERLKAENARIEVEREKNVIERAKLQCLEQITKMYSGEQN